VFSSERLSIFFEDECFEHQYDSEGVATGVRESFFIVDFVEGIAKDFPVDEGIEFRQEVVELVDVIELPFEGKEGVLTFVHGGKGKKTDGYSVT
jgi:hypothetical protein